jgi:hypothetical protein
VGLLSAWRKSGERARAQAEGRWYHYQRSCPVAEVRVSQLVWSRRRVGSGGNVFESGSRFKMGKLRITNAICCPPLPADGAATGWVWDGKGTATMGRRGRLLYLILHALRHGSGRD